MYHLIWNLVTMMSQSCVQFLLAPNQATPHRRTAFCSRQMQQKIAYQAKTCFLCSIITGTRSFQVACQTRHWNVTRKFWTAGVNLLCSSQPGDHCGPVTNNTVQNFCCQCMEMSFWNVLLLKLILFLSNLADVFALWKEKSCVWIESVLSAF